MLMPIFCTEEKCLSKHAVWDRGTYIEFVADDLPVVVADIYFVALLHQLHFLGVNVQVLVLFPLL
jgi:hypothetical protein